MLSTRTVARRDAILRRPAGPTTYTLRVPTVRDHTSPYTILLSPPDVACAVPISHARVRPLALATATFQGAAVALVHLPSYGPDLPPSLSILGLPRRRDGHLRFPLGFPEPTETPSTVVCVPVPITAPSEPLNRVLTRTAPPETASSSSSGVFV